MKLKRNNKKTFAPTETTRSTSGKGATKKPLVNTQVPKKNNKKVRVMSAPLGRNSQPRAKVTPAESQLP